MQQDTQNNVRETSSVFVTIVGRPNVGKSSLLNRLVGEKAAIVTPKPQTTRTRVTGIATRRTVQTVLIDTPGLHVPRTKLGRCMMKTAEDSLKSGDVTLMLFEPEGALRPAEEEMVARLRGAGAALAAVNKADTVRGQALARRVEEMKNLRAFTEVLAVSAATGEGCGALMEKLGAYAVRGPHFFADDMYTDQPEKVLAAEIVREKLLLCLQEEIPHGTAVEVQRFKERDGGRMVDIEVTIYCEKKSHKGMIIGRGGQMLKQVASAARAELEDMLASRVNLQCWVKVRDNWRDNDALLTSMGFDKPAAT